MRKRINFKYLSVALTLLLVISSIPSNLFTRTVHAADPTSITTKESYISEDHTYTGDIVFEGQNAMLSIRDHTVTVDNINFVNEARLVLDGTGILIVNGTLTLGANSQVLMNEKSTIKAEKIILLDANDSINGASLECSGDVIADGDVEVGSNTKIQVIKSLTADNIVFNDGSNLSFGSDDTVTKTLKANKNITFGYSVCSLVPQKGNIEAKNVYFTNATDYNTAIEIKGTMNATENVEIGKGYTVAVSGEINSIGNMFVKGGEIVVTDTGKATANMIEITDDNNGTGGKLTAQVSTSVLDAAVTVNGSFSEAEIQCSIDKTLDAINCNNLVIMGDEYDKLIFGSVNTLYTRAGIKINSVQFNGDAKSWEPDLPVTSDTTIINNSANYHTVKISDKEYYIGPGGNGKINETAFKSVYIIEKNLGDIVNDGIDSKVIEINNALPITLTYAVSVDELAPFSIVNADKTTMDFGQAYIVDIPASGSKSLTIIAEEGTSPEDWDIETDKISIRQYSASSRVAIPDGFTARLSFAAKVVSAIDVGPGGEEPPVENTDPPVENTDPPVENTDPPVDNTDPPEEKTDPPAEETNPPEEKNDIQIEEKVPQEEKKEEITEKKEDKKENSDIKKETKEDKKDTKDDKTEKENSDNQNTERTLKRGSGSVSVNSVNYGVTPQLTVSSETNDPKGATVTYMSGNEVYNDMPTAVGEYRVKAVFPANDSYDGFIATASFSITYLTPPNELYILKGSEGDNDYYLDDVKIVAPQGYKISTALDGTYQKELEYSRNMNLGYVYLLKEDTGEKTSGVYIKPILIDKSDPLIEGIDDNIEIYAETLSVSISDENLLQVKVNGIDIAFSGKNTLIDLVPEDGLQKFTIEAVDKAGRKTVRTVTVMEEWRKDNVVPRGKSVKLIGGEKYTAGSDGFNVEGDSSSYSGGITFYVPSDMKVTIN